MQSVAQLWGMARKRVEKRRLPVVHRDTPHKVYLGEWLTFLGVTAAELARSTGASESHISLICGGTKFPSLLQLSRFEDALDLRPGTLLEPPPSPETLVTLGRFSDQEIARFRRARS